MKKVLILTGSTGGGHIQAAKSLESEYKNNGFDTLVLDIFGSRGKFLNALITEGYDFLVETLPTVYDKMYDLADSKYFNSDLARIICYEAKRNVKSTIDSFQPDVIVGTHPFVVHIAKSFKKKNIITCPTLSIVTDFKAHYSYIDQSIDAYITASDYTSNTIVDRHINNKKVFSYGIPVRNEFRDYCKTSFEKEKIENILVMGGSMGSTGIIKTLEALVENENNFNMTVVCGRNEVLKTQLEDQYKVLIGNGRLQVIGFATNVHELMDQCDLIITKPGGLTSSEAINKRVPMVIPFTFPGQEKENVDFLVDRGIAVHIPSYDQLNERINVLANNPVLYKRMKNNMAEIASNYSTQNIVNLSLSLINEQDNMIAPQGRKNFFSIRKGVV